VALEAPLIRYTLVTICDDGINDDDFGYKLRYFLYEEISIGLITRDL
jgi:hypothetical protein